MSSNSSPNSSFVIKKTLGKGGEGTAYLVEESETGHKYVLKIYNMKRFAFTEYNILKFIKDKCFPLFTCLYSMIKVDRKYGILIDYDNSISLYTILDKNKLTNYEKCCIMLNICKSIKELHNINVCHKDIKPQNILIDDNLNVKIIDFGIACKSENNNCIKRHTLTPAFISPEAHYEYKRYGEYNFSFEACKEKDLWTTGYVCYLIAINKPYPDQSADWVMNMYLSDLYKGRMNLDFKYAECGVFENIIKTLWVVDPKKRDIDKTIEQLLQLKSQLNEGISESLKSYIKDYNEKEDDKSNEIRQIINIRLLSDDNITDIMNEDYISTLVNIYDYHKTDMTTDELETITKIFDRISKSRCSTLYATHIPCDNELYCANNCSDNVTLKSFKIPDLTPTEKHFIFKLKFTYLKM